jgi:hypothetical protein
MVLLCGMDLTAPVEEPAAGCSEYHDERPTAGRYVTARPRLEECRLFSDDRSSFVELGRGVHRGSLTTRLIVLFTREPFNIAFPTVDSRYSD